MNSIANLLRRAAIRTLPSSFFSCVLLLWLSSAVFGDGCYIPERAVRKIPEISSQVAVLSWKEGVETLVISSALDSESQKLGWIIPLPAVPESIEKQSPGGLKTLDFCLQPEITHDLLIELKATILTVVLGNLILGTMLFKREYLLRLLIVLLLLAVFNSLLLSAGSERGSAAKSNKLSVEKSVAVGSYDISIMKASKVADLNAWLGENQFASLPPAADKIVEEYLSRGWVFAAIKLARSEAGANSPHPLQMRFASKEAVYPMKLTSIAGGRPEFELFVIADKKASCDAIPEVFCDKFVSDKNDSDDPENEPKTKFTGMNSDLKIGHSAIVPLMWDNCVLTRFVGAIDAAKMTADLQFDWVPFKAFRQHFYTKQGATESAILSIIALSGLWVFVSMWSFRKSIRQPLELKKYFRYVIAPSFVVSALIAVVGFMYLPKLTDSEVQISSRLRFVPQDLYWNIKDWLESPPEMIQGSEQEIVEAIRKHPTATAADKKIRINEITGTELKNEDSPGNFTVEKKEDGGIIIRIYEYDGSAWILKYPIPKSERQSE